MSIKVTIREVPSCRCGNREDFTLLADHSEVALLHKLSPGVHPRKFDGRCGRCDGPVELACNVTVKLDGLKLVK